MRRALIVNLTATLSYGVPGGEWSTRLAGTWPFDGPLELHLKGIQGGSRAWVLDPKILTDPIPAP